LQSKERESLEKRLREVLADNERYVRELMNFKEQGNKAVEGEKNKAQ